MTDADPIYAEPRLAAVSDPLDPDRSDLDVYERIVVDELGATSALDVGCGTGELAIRLARRGVRATGVDPAAASVDVARGKPGAEAVTWIVGTAPDAPAMQVDVATMTANVAQVFVDDDAWLATLRAIRARLRDGGALVLEARRPHARAWEGWTKDATHQVVDVPGVGEVEDWVDVTSVDGELVTFESPTVFRADGARYESTTTLRFRPLSAIARALEEAGFAVREVRDAPDRPGREWVVLADAV
ncbi:class I SAM-dependent methyltransferase [Agrococcus jejuensis]|uniref:class I SAM-dependent methyltransferase n=1 Tax=Agrococcus jejuensis TaxID=399736 RepID=UPI0011A67C3E|nr:class I SAM-dependent methyltransferase [Agrococcus jejuensis]